MSSISTWVTSNPDLNLGLAFGTPYSVANNTRLRYTVRALYFRIFTVAFIFTPVKVKSGSRDTECTDGQAAVAKIFAVSFEFEPLTAGWYFLYTICIIEILNLRRWNPGVKFNNQDNMKTLRVPNLDLLRSFFLLPSNLS